MDPLNRTQISRTVCACVSGFIFISAKQTAQVQNDLRHVYPETHTKALSVTVRNHSGDRNNKTFPFAYSKAINVDLLLFFHIDKGRGRQPESIRICCRDNNVELDVCSNGDVRLHTDIPGIPEANCLVWPGKPDS